jgi:hypothetical protein
MPLYTDRVPYLGLVEWSQAEIDDYAHDLAMAHQPRRGLRHRGHCQHCGTKSPCHAQWWAAGVNGANELDKRAERPPRDAVIATAGVLVAMALFVVMVIV